MFFQIFVAKGDTGQFFLRNNTLSTIQVSKFLGGPSFNILIQKYFSEEWGQIYQFSLKSKTAEGNSVAISFP